MIIVDASILSGVFFEEPAAGGVLEEIKEIEEIEASRSGGLVAPDFVLLELANTVISNRRKLGRRSDPSASASSVNRLNDMPTSLLTGEIRRRLAIVDLVLEPALTERRYARALHIAELHRLSMYDACYVALAEELGATLATLDRAMQDAARQLGIPVLPSRGLGGSSLRVN
jgi:predicted nucleic acid-binding protein